LRGSTFVATVQSVDAKATSHLLYGTKAVLKKVRSINAISLGEHGADRTAGKT